MYIRYSFIKLMKQYQRVYKANSGSRLEKKVSKLDSRVLGKRHPRRLIGAFRDKKHWCIVFLKRIGSAYLPSVYKALRQKRDDKAMSRG